MADMDEEEREAMSDTPETTRGANNAPDTATPASASPETPAASTTSAAAEASPVSGGATGGDEAATLRQRVSELEAAVAREREAATDYMQRWQRAQADFSNLRRRTQQEQDQLRQIAVAQASALVFPALDALDRAFATLPSTLRGFTWIAGIGLVHMQLHDALGALGVRPVAAEPGQPLDPTRHEAIGEVETSEHPAGAVAVVVQQGYEANGMLIRPALVQVAKAPVKPAGEGPTTVEGAPPAEAPPAATASGGPDASSPG